MALQFRKLASNLSVYLIKKKLNPLPEPTALAHALIDSP